MTDPRYEMEIPPGLIARYPAERRDASRLMVVDPSAGTIETGRRFEEITELLRAGDVIVVNDSRVFPARLEGRRSSGGRVEVLLLRAAGRRVPALVRPLSRLRDGEEIRFAGGAARLESRTEEGTAVLDFGAEDAGAVAARCGRVPLPPYLGREDEPIDRERYQTVYAREGGSAAAPTAGLHFTPLLLDAVAARGVTIARVRLDVGYATFSPVREGQERLHRERYEIPAATLEAIARRPAGARVVAVGTTAVRALESHARTGLSAGETDIFIRPGHPWRVVDALVTNFHLPGSSLLMLVHAFAGDLVFTAYRRAVEEDFRFFSYGDAMFIAGRAA